jgi:hypothetical protein
MRQLITKFRYFLTSKIVIKLSEIWVQDPGSATLLGSVTDPLHFYADPAFHYDADPDPAIYLLSTEISVPVRVPRARWLDPDQGS